MKKTITIFKGDYEFLSNTYPCSVEYNGYTYLNAEAAFQAAKNDEDKEKFTNLSGYWARKLGHKIKLRPDWNDVKIDIMKKICWNKFTQNPELKKKLLETGNAALINGNHHKETFWGCDLENVDCIHKMGENVLGNILMEIRDKLGREDAGYLEHLKEIIIKNAGNMSFRDRNEIVAVLRMPGVLEDLESLNMGREKKLTDDELKSCAERYLIELDYDSGLSYWENLKGLMNKVLDERTPCIHDNQGEKSSIWQNTSWTPAEKEPECSGYYLLQLSEKQIKLWGEDMVVSSYDAEEGKFKNYDNGYFCVIDYNDFIAWRPIPELENWHSAEHKPCSTGNYLLKQPEEYKGLNLKDLGFSDMVVGLYDAGLDKFVEYDNTTAWLPLPERYVPDTQDAETQRKKEIRVEVSGGYLVAEPYGDPDYPGINIDFIDKNGDYGPRVLVEQNEGSIHTLVWRDYVHEDYTDEVVFEKKPEGWPWSKIGEYIPAEMNRGKEKIIRETYRQGFVFKDDEAFYNHMDKVCYIPEISNQKYTHRDILELCDGQEDIARLAYEYADWQHISTIVDEWIREKEIEICKNCKKMFLIAGKTHCPHCGAEYKTD